MATFRLSLQRLWQSHIPSHLCKPTQAWKIPSHGYAVKKLTGAKGAKAMAAAGGVQRKRLEVETDPEKLCKFVCGGNIYKEGSDPELKPDSEYPDWLWELRTERGSVPLEELEPDTYKYWQCLRHTEMKRVAKLRKAKHKFKDFRKVYTW
ncbi:hypothetical protein NP493_563g04058 [Ridgeia piscesae]|uniref:Large ribosomal subunit protein mL54 n=1 Tax=Ridgeia piscesae TaxID=27915 RepID=A0AAD9KUU6_RIDPI|nr:hypothetical protein NP493_563g04058 [Ridgeia piscesae]